MKNKYTILITPSVFYILFAIGTDKKHGYEIMKYVKEISNGKILIGPGTLYGSIKRMLSDGLIEEAGEEIDPSINKRRHYYRLTNFGKKCLSSELQRYSEILNYAKKQKLLTQFLTNWSI